MLIYKGFKYKVFFAHHCLAPLYVYCWRRCPRQPSQNVIHLSWDTKNIHAPLSLSRTPRSLSFRSCPRVIEHFRVLAPAVASNSALIVVHYSHAGIEVAWFPRSWHAGCVCRCGCFCMFSNGGSVCCIFDKRIDRHTRRLFPDINLV